MKKFLKENRIFVILMSIVLVCIVVITSLLLVYFYTGNSKDKYGNRLANIADLKITSSAKETIINSIKEDDKVKEVSIDIYGKIVYLNVTFEEGTALDVAESKALAFLENFTEEELLAYDFQISLEETSEDGYLISGAKNNGSSIIVWNNNRISEE